MRYFLHIGYDGTDYRGWQRQANTHKTIQEVLESNLKRIFGSAITVFGCGRTDAGVHASQYVFHININAAPDFDFKYRLNKNLPLDIAVYDIMKVDSHHHARYHASARSYDYFIHWEKHAILHRYSSYYDKSFNFGLMQEATGVILETTDFRAVCKQPDIYENTRCNVTKCKLYINIEQNRMRFSITSNRFLRGMIRYCVHFLLKIGMGEMSVKEFKEILSLEREYNKKKPAYPNGLFLSRVEYPFIEFNQSNAIYKLLKVGLE